MLKSLFFATTLFSIVFSLESTLLADTYIDLNDPFTNFGNNSFVLSNNQNQSAYFKFETPPHNVLQSANLILTLCEESTCGIGFPVKQATNLSVYFCAQTWSGEIRKLSRKSERERISL